MTTHAMLLPERAVILPLAALVTLGLFYAMTVLIRNDDGLDLIVEPSPAILTFVREIEDKPPQIKEIIKRPPPVEKQPKTRVNTTADTFTSGTEVGPIVFDLDSEPRITPALNGAEGDAMPLVTSPPEYPPALAKRGVEGWVVVEFSIDTLGRVINPFVVEGQPKGAFDRAALRAIQRYKYKPKVLNGEGVTVSGMRQRILFDLES